MYIPELSGVLMEIDPRYSFDNGISVWASLRYFGKQYGNPTNAFTYNGWWENFGGIDYRVSRNINLKITGYQLPESTRCKRLTTRC